MRRYYNRSRLLPGLVVGIVVGIFIVVLLILLSSASSSDPDLASDSETQDTTSDVICEVEIAGERMVFDEPANPTRASPLLSKVSTAWWLFRWIIGYRLIGTILV
jgi:MFS superfamily sulfate permease-like transporter